MYVCVCVCMCVFVCVCLYEELSILGIQLIQKHFHQIMLINTLTKKKISFTYDYEAIGISVENESEYILPVDR